MDIQKYERIMCLRELKIGEKKIHPGHIGES